MKGYGVDREDNQNPTKELTLEYKNSYGEEACGLYAETGREVQEWQKRLVDKILAVNDEGLWVHTKFGYSVPRRNGKNEVIAIREIYGLEHAEHILHTAHRTSTSSAAFNRLIKLMKLAGYTERLRRSKEPLGEMEFLVNRTHGFESIELYNEGHISFRTRTDSGGLGEGFDLLIIDEAQEYTDSQATALKYTVSDSKNPQTIFCGTPPTAVSGGTVFVKMRDKTLAGESENTGWAEWSVVEMTDVHDREAWYRMNPSFGTIISERSIADEVGDDDLDFNIQRLGYWIRYNLKSVISEKQWKELTLEKPPEAVGKIHVGIKYGKDGHNVSMSIAVKCKDGRDFVSGIGCQNFRNGSDWIINWLAKADPARVVIDGMNGQQLLTKAMAEARLKKPILPTVKEIITANAMFEQMLINKEICHRDQPALTQSVSNCDHRAIGSNGGFGYKSIKDSVDVSLMESMILALWSLETQKAVRQQINY